MGRCGSDLTELFSLHYSRGRSTRYSNRLYDFSVTIPGCYDNVYVKRFFPQTAGRSLQNAFLWVVILTTLGLELIGSFFLWPMTLCLELVGPFFLWALYRALSFFELFIVGTYIWALSMLFIFSFYMEWLPIKTAAKKYYSLCIPT